MNSVKQCSRTEPPFSLIQFILARRLILGNERLVIMDPELLVKMKTAYLELRAKMLLTGQTMNEEDVICETRVTQHLGNLARIWAKQSEDWYDTNYPSGNNPPEASNGGEGGPVPTK